MVKDIEIDGNNYFWSGGEMVLFDGEFEGETSTGEITYKQLLEIMGMNHKDQTNTFIRGYELLN
ncbi:MAG: hypothetical protein IKX10_08275 [Lachnospiraceae bacterium]|nr:hypothetical protein [Lachnospiraceae bacterium]